MPEGYIELPDWLRPAGPAQPAAGAQPASGGSPAAVELRLPDGRRVAVRGRTLLGRAPQPRAGELPATLVRTGDDLSVSKTHLLVEPAGPDAVLITDRGSTNGTGITGVDGVHRRCDPESPIRVRRGERIKIGDLEVEVT